MGDDGAFGSGKAGGESVKVTDADIARNLGAPPFPTTHPGTGAPFVAWSVDIRSDDERVHWGPPTRPSRECVDYDEDGLEFDVILTDEQFAAATAAYDRAMAEWRQTGGLAYVKGPTTVVGKFTCANGAWAEYMTAPGADGWRETRWEGRTRR